jgi:hypothetical protein
MARKILDAFINQNVTFVDNGQVSKIIITNKEKKQVHNHGLISKPALSIVLAIFSIIY